ncbi:MAG: hypothetical protein RH862_20190 [Leptospiraceae bacterium]
MAGYYRLLDYRAAIESERLAYSGPKPLAVIYCGFGCTFCFPEYHGRNGKEGPDYK